MSRSSPVVAFCGSRGLPASAAPLVVRVVGAVLARGSSVVTGCASGGDALVVRAFLSLGVSVSRLSVFAVGGAGGSGFWSGSALAVVRRAAGAGVFVRWWAGGVSSVPLRARLAARSRACFSAAVSSGAGRGVVGFVGGGWSVSPGSWSSVRFALSLGVPVVVFPVGCSVSCFPRRFRGVRPGRWVPCSGAFASGFLWSSGG